MDSRRGLQPTSRWGTRAQLLSRYELALSEQEAVPFIYPWSTAAAGIVLAYLLIPQGRSRNVHRMRYLIWAINAAFSLYGILYSRMRISLGYGGGLLSAWAILWTSVLVLNNNVQHDFKRIKTIWLQPFMKETGANGHTVATVSDEGTKRGSERKQSRYQWEAFPVDSLIDRLLWTVDLFTGLRGISWNWQLPTLAPPPLKVRKQLGEDDTSDSTIGRDGTRRYDDRGELLRVRGIQFVACYLALDALTVMAIHDPYFWGVIDSPSPEYLPKIVKESMFLCRAYRNIFTMLAVYAALQFFFALGPLFFVGILGSTRIGVWGEPWAYPDVWGSFQMVADYGLTGFWGSWWHQAFRYAFESNASAIARAVGLSEQSTAGKTTKLILVFALSGFLHASGSHASLGHSRPLSGSFAFFIAQPFAILAQMLLKRSLRKAGIATKTPRLARQLFTLTATYLWLHFTAPLLCDDFARAGIWMIEPIPVSLLRGFGMGDPQDGWWCWRGSWVTWHRGKHWWQTGIAL